MLEPYIILNSVVANGVGRNIFVKDMKKVMLTIATSGLSSGKSFNLIAKASANDTSPDFHTAKSITNLWDYVQMLKFPDATPVEGSTGDTFSGADDVRMYEINVDGMTWFNVEVTGLADATVTILGKVMGYDVAK